jgi:hypothetical protein
MFNAVTYTIRDNYAIVGKLPRDGFVIAAQERGLKAPF